PRFAVIASPDRSRGEATSDASPRLPCQSRRSRPITTPVQKRRASQERGPLPLRQAPYPLNRPLPPRVAPGRVWRHEVRYPRMARPPGTVQVHPPELKVRSQVAALFHHDQPRRYDFGLLPSRLAWLGTGHVTKAHYETQHHAN